MLYRSGLLLAERSTRWRAAFTDTLTTMDVTVPISFIGLPPPARFTSCEQRIKQTFAVSILEANRRLSLNAVNLRLCIMSQHCVFRDRAECFGAAYSNPPRFR